MSARCPHGDATCPCPDGLACHYEASLDDAGDLSPPWPCPNPPPCEHLCGDASCSVCAVLGGCPATRTDRLHCHVEGCRWGSEGCGLARLGVTAEAGVDPGDPAWACGARRAAVVLIDALGW